MPRPRQTRSLGCRQPFFSTTNCHQKQKNVARQTSWRQLNTKILSCRQQSSFPSEKVKLLSCRQLAIFVFSCRALVSQTTFFGCRWHFVVDDIKNVIVDNLITSSLKALITYTKILRQLISRTCKRNISLLFIFRKFGKIFLYLNNNFQGNRLSWFFKSKELMRRKFCVIRYIFLKISVRIGYYPGLRYKAKLSEINSELWWGSVIVTFCHLILFNT